MKGLDNLVQIITFGVFFYASFLATLHYMRNRVKWFQSIPEKLQPNTSLRYTTLVACTHTHPPSRDFILLIEWFFIYFSRLVSSIHSTIAVILSIYILYTDNDLSQSKILYNSPAISFTLNLTTGFLLYGNLCLNLISNRRTQKLINYSLRLRLPLVGCIQRRIRMVLRRASFCFNSSLLCMLHIWCISVHSSVSSTKWSVFDIY